MSQAVHARPYAPQPLQEADILGAVYDLVLAYCQPAMNPDHIFRAWVNRASLPPGTNEYAIITVIGEARRGSNVELFAFDPNTEEDGVFTLEESKKIAVQVDFFGDEAKRRANTLELLSRSETGARFFEPYGIAPLHADDPKEITGTDGSEQQVPRYMTTLYLSAKASLGMSVGWFNDVNLKPEVLT